MEQFSPIALANFKFKIISKVLADKLVTLMSYLVSKELRGFINGRQVKDGISLALKVVNCLKKKT